MAGITLASAQARLDALLAAHDKVLKGQQVEIDGQMIRRADLPSIQEGIEFWDRKVKELTQASNGRSRGRTVAPLW